MSRLTAGSETLLDFTTMISGSEVCRLSQLITSFVKHKHKEMTHRRTAYISKMKQPTSLLIKPLLQNQMTSLLLNVHQHLGEATKTRQLTHEFMQRMNHKNQTGS